MTTDIGRQMIELAANGLDLKTPPALRQDGLFEPIVQIVSQHFDQKKHLVGFEIALTVLIKGKAFLELVDLVLNVTALVVIVEDLGCGHRLDIGYDKLVCVFDGIDIHLLLLFVIGRDKFSDQDESVAFLPVRQAVMALIDDEGLIDVGPGKKVFFAIDAVDEKLQALVFLMMRNSRSC